MKTSYEKMMDKEVLQAVVDIVLMDIRDNPQSIDSVISGALEAEVDVNFTNAGNSWQRTSGDRWGITPEQVKAALKEIK